MKKNLFSIISVMWELESKLENTTTDVMVEDLLMALFRNTLRNIYLRNTFKASIACQVPS